MEINGFEIEEYNVHKIKQGAKTSTCPKCSHLRKPQNQKQKCASVFWDTGILHCNHCGERTQMHTYKKKNEKKEYKKPVLKPKSAYSKEVLDWFNNVRGISEKTLKKAKVSEGFTWMPKAGKQVKTIEFNYYLHDELINVKSRAKGKDFKFEKDCELIMYNLDSIIGDKECLLVEGEPDALSWMEAGYDAVSSVPNGFTLPREDGTSTINLTYLDDYYHVFEDKEIVYLAFDNDTAGEEGTKEFIRRLGAEKCYLIDLLDCKDSNDFLLKYGSEALLRAKENAKPVPLEDIKTIKDVQDELIDFWINGAPKGKTIGIEGVDNSVSFESKQYTLVVAPPGSGKSDFIDHLCCRFAIQYDDRTGICSTENKPLKFHYDKLFKKIHGRRPKEEDINSNLVSETFDFIGEHIYHVEKNNRYYLEDVLKKFAELVKRKGCRFFILDPFNKINLKSVSKGDINHYTAEYHQMLDEFVTKYDVHLFLVLHPNKMKLREGSTKTFLMPTAYDAKGGGEHFDMSYNILGLVRDYERNLVQFRTLKVKFQHLGVAGVDTWVGWNINNGRYTEIEGYYDENTTDQPVLKWDNKSWLVKEKEEIDFSKQGLPNLIEPEKNINLSPEEAFGNDAPF